MGRIPYLETPAQALQLIRPRHREIMRRLVVGQSQKEIAEEMGLSLGRLSIIINSPLFKAELMKMEKDVRAKAVETIGDVSVRIAKLQNPAVDILEHIIFDKEKKIGIKLRKDTALDVLELSGSGKKKRNEEGMNDFAQFIAAAFTEAKARHIERLELQSEEFEKIERGALPPADKIQGGTDLAGDPLSVDEAEDIALSSFSVIDIEAEPETEVKKEDSSPSFLAQPSQPPQTSSERASGGNGNGSGNGDGGGNGNGSSHEQEEESSPKVLKNDTALDILLQAVMEREGLDAKQLKKLLDQT